MRILLAINGVLIAATVWLLWTIKKFFTVSTQDVGCILIDFWMISYFLACKDKWMEEG